MTDIPHFSLPFRFATPNVATSEQDSIEEISDCVLAVLLCPLGYRVELPDFGLVDLTFSTPHVDVGEIRDAVELWEPRAAVALREWQGDT
jgi:phage baseplate assembly protein W